MNQQKQERPIISHGFQYPYGVNYYQLVATLLFIALYILSMLAVKYSIESQDLIELFYITNSLLGVGVIVLWVNTTLINPTDDEVLLQYELMKNGNVYKSNLKIYCTVCKAYVLENSKHCSNCNRCTQKFDHHCIWLNNCIGSKNYKSFFFLVLLLTLMLIMELTIQTIGIINGLILSYFAIVLQILVIIPVTFLLIMHCYFRLQGITTYDFIIRRKQKQNNQEERTKGSDTRLKIPQSTKLVSQEILNTKQQQQPIHLQIDNFYSDANQDKKQNEIEMEDEADEDYQLKNKGDQFKQVNWEKEDVEVPDNPSFHAIEPMKQIDFKNTGRDADPLSSDRRSCPQTKRKQSLLLVEPNAHKQMKSLFSMHYLKHYYEENLVKIDEESIVKVQSKGSQRTEQFENQEEKD